MLELRVQRSSPLMKQGWEQREQFDHTTACRRLGGQGRNKTAGEEERLAFTGIVVNFETSLVKTLLVVTPRAFWECTKLIFTSSQWEGEGAELYFGSWMHESAEPVARPGPAGCARKEVPLLLGLFKTVPNRKSVYQGMGRAGDFLEGQPGCAGRANVNKLKMPE